MCLGKKEWNYTLWVEEYKNQEILTRTEDRREAGVYEGGHGRGGVKRGYQSDEKLHRTWPIHNSRQKRAQYQVRPEQQKIK